MLPKANPTETPVTGAAETALVTASAKLKAADRIRGQLMQMALRDLLNQVRGARDALPHLAALEKALRQRGANAVYEVPPQWRAKIAAQLSSLPIRDDDRELGELLARLTGTLQVRQEIRLESAHYLSDFHVDGRVEVGEVSHSEFNALMNANTNVQPAA